LKKKEEIRSFAPEHPVPGMSSSSRSKGEYGSVSDPGEDAMSASTQDDDAQMVYSFTPT
jgi:hypothetical protein